jgi:hypothetical protein
MMKIAATTITDSIWDSKHTAGAIKYWTAKDQPNDVRGFNYTCPCGCGRIGGVRFSGPAYQSGQPTNGWNWNGNRVAPTVKPSIHLQVDDGSGNLVSHWHGWLTDGHWSLTP